MEDLSSILFIILGLVALVGTWKMFEKAGEEGWKAIIPIYNTYTMFKIVYGNGWKFLLMLIPIVNLIIFIIFCIDLAKVFGKSTGFGIANIFVPFVTYPILGFGDDTYRGIIDKEASVQHSNDSE